MNWKSNKHGRMFNLLSFSFIEEKRSMEILSETGKMCSSPCTVRAILTSTDPSRFLATHSYSAVSSCWTLLTLREPLFRVEKWSLPSRGRPWRDHSMTGVGSPSAWQLSTTVVPASTTVFTGSTTMVGAPDRPRQIHVNSRSNNSSFTHRQYSMLL